MSVGESMTTGGFNQKTVKGDLFVKVNHVYLRRRQHGKVLEDTKRQYTEPIGRLAPRAH
jgi:hypothetical protein